MNIRLLASMVVIAATTLTVGAQNDPQQPAFRSEVNLVRLPVRALDDNGTPVRDLNASDFNVSEDGVPQTIASFAYFDGQRREPRTSDGRSALPSRSVDLDTSRIYLIIIDDYHLVPSELIQAKQILKDFFTRHLLAGDNAAIVIASGGGQDFTTNLNLLLRTIDRLRASPLRVTGPGFAGPAEKRIRASSVLRTLADASIWMGREGTRRKTVILISSDVGCSAVTSTVSCGLELQDSIQAARNGGASVYPLAPGGMFNPGYCPPENGGGPCSPSARRMNPRSPGSALNVLAQDTGGFVIADTNRYAEALDRVDDDGGSYYLFSYYSNNEFKNRKPRRILVTAKRNDIQLFYRQSYVIGSKK